MLPAMLAVHVVIGVGEAVITVPAALNALMATRPDLIGGWAAAETVRNSPGSMPLRGPERCAASRLSRSPSRSTSAARSGPLASSARDGLVKVGERQGSSTTAVASPGCRSMRPRAGTRSPACATSGSAKGLAGFAGSLAVFLLGAGGWWR